MSQAHIRAATRRSRTYYFGPGRLERLTLTVARHPRGLITARLTGNAYVACGLGNEHYPEVEIEASNNERDDDAGTILRSLDGDLDAAVELAEELETAALDDWFDPCEAEGLGEEDAS